MATNEKKQTLTANTQVEQNKVTAQQNTGTQMTGYTPSESVIQAQQLLQQQQANKPGAYQSTWQQQTNDMLQQILNRKPFTYDLNRDALYQQLTDQYVSQGRMAMMDTVGQTAALTGGYGNSYAQNAGQQAYHGYLQQLNAQVPELYQMALDQYNQEGQDLMDRYALLGTQEEQDYGRYMDQLDAYYAERDRLQSLYDAERDYDYGKWADERNFAYQQERDAAADAQWQAEYDEAIRQWNALHGGSSGSSSGPGNPGSDGKEMNSGEIRDYLLQYKGDYEAMEHAAEKLIKQLGDDYEDEVWEVYGLLIGDPKDAKGKSVAPDLGYALDKDKRINLNKNSHTKA